MNIHGPPGEKHVEMYLTSLDGSVHLVELVVTVQCAIKVISVGLRAVVVPGREGVCGGCQAHIMSR